MLPTFQFWNKRAYRNNCKREKHIPTLSPSVWILANIQSDHGLRTPGEEITFTAWRKINFHSQIFSYSRSIFCLPHRPKFSDFFDLCLHWVSVVRVFEQP